MTNNAVKNYYDEIASTYDESRFDNSYGKFIDRQERQFLARHLKSKNVLNLGCGTGRFMEYSSVGLDVSPVMLEEARKKFPDKQLIEGSAFAMPFQEDSFDAVICFHVIMHLNLKDTQAIFEEVHRVLKPGGIFIFDYPSAERRKLTRYKSQNWHGANAFRKEEIKRLFTDYHFSHKTKKGVLFSPIHRLPKIIRPAFYGLDQLLTKSPWRHYSSYLIHAIEKK